MVTSDIQNKVLNANSLFDKVSAWGQKDTGRTKIGYAVSTYEHALDALKQSKIVIEQVVQEDATPRGGPIGQSITRDYSSLAKGNWGSDAGLVNGFLFKNGTQKMYQGLTYIFDYMSFIVDMTVIDKPQTLCVGVNRPYADKETPCLLGNNKQIPNDISKENIERCKIVLGSNPFVVGVGLSFRTFCAQFMETYFPDAKLDSEKLRSYAAQGKLFAEISIPTKHVRTGQSSSANVIHAMVTCDVGGEIGGDAASQLESVYKLWFPYPMMLLNDYNSITNVKIDTKDGKQIIGTGDAKFPLASSKYNHKNGQIYDFSPQYILNYCSFTGVFKEGNYSCELTQNGSFPARVRLYLDPSLKGTDGLPNDDQLYKGHYDVSKQQIIQGGYADLGLPKGQFRVLIDVGHMKNTRKTEPELNLAISRQFQKALGRLGVASDIIEGGELVVGSQTPRHKLERTLYDKAIQGRKRIGEDGPWNYNNSESQNDAEIWYMYDYARANKDSYACLISIHCDAYNGMGKGSKVFYHPGAGSNSLSHKLGNSVASFLGDNSVMGGQKSATANSLSLIGAYKFLPSILVECGFYDNPSDLKKLQNPQKQKQIGEAIARGVVEWYNKNNN